MSAYLGNDFTIPGFALSLVASFGVVLKVASYQNGKTHEGRESIAMEYKSAVVGNGERYIGTFNIRSERTEDNRNCSFFGVDLDNDGEDDIRRMRTPLGRGMAYNEYIDLRGD